MAASQSSDDEGNIWAGYVDALTTMTMVMTLIMILLGLVVFGMSQEISRKYIARIAFAADVDADPRRPTALIADEIIEKLSHRMAEVADAAYGAAPGTARTAQPAEQPAAQAGALAAAPVAAQAGGQVDERSPTGAGAIEAALDRFTAQLAAAAAAAVAARDAALQAQRVAAARPAPSDDITATVRPHGAGVPGNARDTAGRLEALTKDAPTEIVSRREAELVRKEEGARIAPGLTSVVVRFRDRALLLDEESVRKLREVTAQNAAFRMASGIEIAGAADVAGNPVSEARRSAYYRVLAIRKELVGAGFDVGQLILKIEDTRSSDSSNTVRLTALRPKE